MVWRHFYKLVFLFPVPWHKLKALNSSFPGDLPTFPTICLFVPYFFPHPEAQVGVPLLMTGIMFSACFLQFSAQAQGKAVPSFEVCVNHAVDASLTVSSLFPCALPSTLDTPILSSHRPPHPHTSGSYSAWLSLTHLPFRNF